MGQNFLVATSLDIILVRGESWALGLSPRSKIMSKLGLTAEKIDIKWSVCSEIFSKSGIWKMMENIPIFEKWKNLKKCVYIFPRFFSKIPTSKMFRSFDFRAFLSRPTCENDRIRTAVRGSSHYTSHYVLTRSGPTIRWCCQPAWFRCGQLVTRDPVGWANHQVGAARALLIPVWASWP